MRISPRASVSLRFEHACYKWGLTLSPCARKSSAASLPARLRNGAALSDRSASASTDECGDRRRIRSRLGSLGTAKFSAGCHNGCHDSGISGAAANLTAELVSDRLGIRICHAQENVPPHNQHAGCAKSALQGVRLMEM